MLPAVKTEVTVVFVYAIVGIHSVGACMLIYK